MMESTDGKQYLEIDPKAREIYEKMQDKKEIDPETWFSLEYSEDENHLKLSGRGENGLEEAKEKAIREDKVAYLIVKGCNVKSKTNCEPVYLLVCWIPKCVTRLKRAISLMNIDEIVRGLDLKSYCLIEPHLIEQITSRYAIKRLNNIRGEENVGRYVFDKEVYTLLNEQAKRTLELMKELPSEKKKEKLFAAQAYVLKEFITTEFTYVKSLNLFYDLFVEPIKLHGHDKLYDKISNSVMSIIGINTKFLKELRFFYTCSEADIKDLSSLKRKLSTFPSDFFNADRIHRILDSISSNCVNFRKYSLYINSYPKMLQDVTNLISKDSKLQAYFKVAERELKSQKERCTDLHGFLIMPIQRIPRYELLVRELSRCTHPNLNMKLFEKVNSLLVQIKEVGDLINQRKETMVNAIKTIFLTKVFDKAYLMQQKMMKFKSCVILRSNLSNKKSKKINLMTLNSKKKSKIKNGYTGIVYVLDHSFIIIKTKNTKAFQVDELLSADINILMKKNKVSLYSEWSLDDPNFRCFKHPQYSEILVVEGELKRYELLFPNTNDCDSIVSMTQNLLSTNESHPHMKSMFSMRPLFRSFLTQRNESSESKLLYEINAGMKIKIYTDEGQRFVEKMICSFSISGCKYGKLESENWFFIDVEKKKTQLQKMMEMTMSPKKKKKSKKKKDHIQRSEQVGGVIRYKFLASDDKEMNAWLGILERLENYCKHGNRKDDVGKKKRGKEEEVEGEGED